MVGGGRGSRPDQIAAVRRSRLKVTQIVLRLSYPSLVEGSEDPSHTQLPPLSSAASFIELTDVSQHSRYARHCLRVWAPSRA